MRFVLAPALLLATTALQLQAQAPASTPPAAAVSTPPPVAREFRGVWVASVANIDWPSRPGLGVWDQQAELLAILNRSVALRLNAVILQVRPAADALYRSRYEPWSEYLTGDMGREPEPFYDPLAFAVEEAHKRGLELHAWFNPYRAHHANGTGDFSANHLSVARPGLVRPYGRYLWMDPGERTVREHSIRVILDVVKRYDIDGVHIDDYFYPYRERDASGSLIPFPDSESYARYRRAGGELDRDDWRRHNVDLLVEELYRGVKRTKSWVKFGVSPFGIWRPGYPAGVTGLDSYQEIYADSRKWLRNGWLDYFTPQLYWPTTAPGQGYAALLEWWVSQNVKRRHIWPGNFTSRVGADDPRTSWSVGELAEQIRLTRAQPGATGNVHFSMRAFLANRLGLADSLGTGAYALPALVPASRWLDSVPPAKPTIAVRRDTIAGGTRVTLRPAPADSAKGRVWLWVIRARTDGAWSTAIIPGTQRTHALTLADALPAPDLVAISAVDRVGNESAVATWTPTPSRQSSAGGRR
ncbi:MAG: family 10 glycosylhydrolase [Gemmatimonadaceae bacterium]